jgi:RNA polymerase sigma factor (sigma-70 family)
LVDVRSTNAEDFRRCFDAHWAAVCRSLARRGAGAQTEDLAAEAFAIAWRKWRTLPADPLPWLLRTALNLHANTQRKLRRELPLELADSTAAPLAETHGIVASREQTRQVLQALADLTPRDREAILLTAWDRLTAAQAAVVCDCSPGAFRVRLHRARVALKLALASDLPAELTETCT